MLQYTALVTSLAVVFYVFLGTRVAAAHGKYGVTLPAMSGHPEFERIHRIHMNTLEWMPIFLPTLWLCAVYLSDVVAAVIGLVWIGGRLLYYAGYRKSVEKRVPGFLVQAVACLALLFCALAGIVLNWSTA